MKKLSVFHIIILAFVLFCPRVANAADEVYCEWSAYGCDYVIIVSDGGGEGDVGVGVVNCNDGWGLYGTGEVGLCPY